MKKVISTVLICAAIAFAVFYFGIGPKIQQKAKDEAVSKYDSVFKSGQVAQRADDSLKVEAPMLDSIKIVNQKLAKKSQPVYKNVQVVQTEFTDDQIKASFQRNYNLKQSMKRPNKKEEINF